mmetsp:Transcript_15398/g.22589  ORF Transcript_15398/g.22589 Transcript_15398/m.22589 type:complete len:96 (-) Transcript_15398:375-662(-)
MQSSLDPNKTPPAIGFLRTKSINPPGSVAVKLGGILVTLKDVIIKVQDETKNRSAVAVAGMIIFGATATYAKEKLVKLSVKTASRLDCKPFPRQG